MLARRKMTVKTVSIFVITCSLLYIFYIGFGDHFTASIDNRVFKSTASIRDVVQDIFANIRACQPLLNNQEIILDNYKDGKHPPVRAFSELVPLGTTDELDEFLQVSDEQLKTIKKSHSMFVKLLPKKMPPNIYSGAGVVLTVGTKHFPMVMVTLRMLRKVSPNIPVELFMVNSTEYEEQLCEQILPAMNAKCIMFSDIVGQDILNENHVNGYQYKSLALLASSFEDVIFMDADSIPVKDITKILDTEVYKEHGMITWPDYWYRTVSPRFYDIANITLGTRVRGDLTLQDLTKTPEADRLNAIPDKSTESGQMYVNKRRHFRTLVLALYYNIFGYNIYYPLLSQGVVGEGDKETFRAAAIVLNENPSYQVFSDIFPHGHTRPDGSFKGTVIPQADPDQDYRKYYLHEPSPGVPCTMFFHSNVYKLDLKNLFTHTELEGYFEEDTRRRLMGDPETMDGRNPMPYDDIELELWRHVQWFMCDVVVKNKVMVKNYIDVADQLAGYCEKSTGHLKWLEKTTRRQHKNPADYNW